MYSLICAVRRSADRVVEEKVKKEFRTIEEARIVAEATNEIIAYRVFDNRGLRVYTKRVR